MTGVIDYGAGNLCSVMNAFVRLGINASFAAGPEELSCGADGSSRFFDRIVFPGDGHFATAMENLEKSGYAQALKEWIAAGRPFLGICIGLQLMFDYSEEAGFIDGKSAGVKGLGVIAGTVRRFPGRKVPQIGWNQTAARPSSRLFRGLPPN